MTQSKRDHLETCAVFDYTSLIYTITLFGRNKADIIENRLFDFPMTESLALYLFSTRSGVDLEETLLNNFSPEDILKYMKIRHVKRQWADFENFMALSGEDGVMAEYEQWISRRT